MLDFYQRRKFKSILLLPVTRVVLFVLVLLLASSAYTRYKIAAEMADRRVDAEASVEELKVQKQQLQEKVDYLSDERGIEAEMRRQFDVTLPGEQVVVIVEEESNLQPVTASTSESIEGHWYEFWR